MECCQVEGYTSATCASDYYSDVCVLSIMYLLNVIGVSRPDSFQQSIYICYCLRLIGHIARGYILHLMALPSLPFEFTLLQLWRWGIYRYMTIFYTALILLPYTLNFYLFNQYIWHLRILYGTAIVAIIFHPFHQCGYSIFVQYQNEVIRSNINAWFGSERPWKLNLINHIHVILVWAAVGDVRTRRMHPLYIMFEI